MTVIVIVVFTLCAIVRSFVGSHGPAQWPDCNRLVEAIFIILTMTIIGRRKTPDGKSQSRWTQVMHCYNNIQQCILLNAVVMDETDLQLPKINTTTLSQW